MHHRFFLQTIPVLISLIVSGFISVHSVVARAAEDTRAPKVVVSIAPLHSIVASVMQGVAEPDLIVPANASPHIYTMKPSSAQNIQDADLVFWIGSSLESFLVRPLKALAAPDRVFAIMEESDIGLLPLRDNEDFEPHTHDGDAHEDDHGHQHSESHEDHETAIDPHLWLDPKNAIAIARLAAARLSKIDSENQAVYAKNLENFEQRIAQLIEDVAQTLKPITGQSYVVFHDAFQYFEQRFAITVLASVTLHPEVKPGARRLLEISESIRKQTVACIFSEPQFDKKILKTIAEEANVGVAVIDPLGASIPTGPDLFPQLIREIATTIATCSSADS